ncbi:MAG: DinB family protein [Candidatus Aminicenantes bacterium]|nr:DinB family protein [Candidatus Aminicenantes bacterium]
MTGKEYLKFVKGIHKASLGLIKLTPEDKLDFKPMEGVMTIGQVVKHLTDALGGSLTMAINNSWPEIPEGEMLPPAEKMPKANSAAEAAKEIEADWELLNREIEKITDGEFNENKINVPWMPFPMTYLEFMMQAMEHLSNHRMQLFTWLKLSGEKLHTGHLYGLEG